MRLQYVFKYNRISRFWFITNQILTAQIWSPSHLQPHSLWETVHLSGISLLALAEQEKKKKAQKWWSDTKIINTEISVWIYSSQHT